ncbi:hypothetical protein QFZ30_001076 [Arthrobacter pascens]|uniref:hypothetical protein n=1 Tax=Arthrobacter pascens TaxID=1677 RepID=UPI0027921954|nr:hypothetical protein [Arthrobacter pascens]MDQ0677694.1 hypothetical protein [Arthrobacter pascens]
MVDYRSELSRSRTGIHGGIRRGTAAAAVGAVLVLSAGIPASQAADGSPDSGEPEVQVTATGELAVVDGLLQGLLGSGTQPASPKPTATTSSPAGTVSPSPTPISPVAPAPTAVSQPPATSSTNAAQAVPTGTMQGAASGTVPSPQGAGSGLQTGSEQQPADQQGPAAAESGATDEPTPGVTAPTAGSTSRSASLQAAGTPAVSRQGMAPAPQPAVEAAKVWLGVGLLGTAGAAGLVFARIRRI